MDEQPESAATTGEQVDLDPESLLEQALLAHWEHRLTDAEALYEQLIAQAPDHVLGRVRYAMLLLQSNRAGAATKVMEPAIVAQPGAVLAQLEQALKRDPGDPATLSLYGLVEFPEGAPEPAQPYLNEARPRVPGHGISSEWQAEIDAPASEGEEVAPDRSVEYDISDQEYQNAEAGSAKIDDSILRERAKLREQLEQHLKAATEFERAGDYDSAEAELQAAQEILPADEEIAARLRAIDTKRWNDVFAADRAEVARQNLEAGDLDAALHLVESALERVPQHPDLIALQQQIHETEALAKDRAEEEERRRLEAEPQRLQEEEEQRRLEAEAQPREEERLCLEAETQRQEEERLRLEAEAQRQWEEEQQRRLESEAQRREEERRRLEAEAQRQEEERRRLEAEAQRQEEERCRLEAEAQRQEEERLRLEAEAQRQRKQEERRRLEAEAQHQREEEDRHKIEAEARRRQEERRRLETEAQRLEEERRRLEAEARQQREEEMRRRAEAETQLWHEDGERHRAEAGTQRQDETSRDPDAMARRLGNEAASAWQAGDRQRCLALAQEAYRLADETTKSRDIALTCGLIWAALTWVSVPNLSASDKRWLRRTAQEIERKDEPIRPNQNRHLLAHLTIATLTGERYPLDNLALVENARDRQAQRIVEAVIRYPQLQTEAREELHRTLESRANSDLDTLVVHTILELLRRRT